MKKVLRFDSISILIVFSYHVTVEEKGKNYE